MQQSILDIIRLLILLPRPQPCLWGFLILDEDDITTFLEAARQTPYFALFHTALFTGMRRSELLALRWCGLDLLLCQLYVTRNLHALKGGRVVIKQPKSAKGRRMIALSPSAASVLREHKEKQALERVMLGAQLKDDDLVFSDPEGKPLLPNTVTHAWIKLVRRTRLKPIRLHDARHSHASILLKLLNTSKDCPGEAGTCQHTNNTRYLQSCCTRASGGGNRSL